MIVLGWCVWFGVWVAIGAYLARVAIDDLHRGPTPGDDRWREFWEDVDR